MPGETRCLMADVDSKIFIHDETPEDGTGVLTHIIYLHQNGQLILKSPHYKFSENCFVSEGGMVVHIWWPGASLEKFYEGIRLWTGRGYEIDPLRVKELRDRVFNG